MRRGVRLHGDWAKAKRVTYRAGARNRKAIDRSVRDEAMLFAREAQRTITRTGGSRRWPPLSTLTLALRRGAAAAPAQLGRTAKGKKPLIRTGDLRRSIGVNREGWGHYFAGVHRSSGMANVAAIHEEGPTRITVTDRMRRFFLYLYIKGVTAHPVPFKRGAVIVIQRRSFLESTMDRFRRGARSRMSTRWFHHYMHGKRAKLRL